MAETKRSMLRHVLGRAGMYGSVFFFALLATVYWTFPYDLVTRRVVSEIERSSGLVLEFSKISPHWRLGLKARDLKIIAGRGGADEKQWPLTSALVRLRPISTLVSGPSIAFDLESDLGRIRGSAIQTRKKDIGLDIDVRGLSLGSLPGLAERLGVGLLGSVSGSLAVSLPQGRPEELSGVVDLRIVDSGLGGGMIGGAPVPPMDLGLIQPRIIAEGGTLRFEPPLSISSDDLDAEISGSLQLRNNFPTSRADITLRFRPTDRFWQANQMLAFARGMINDALQGDGYYAYRLSGAIGRPDFQAVR